MNEKSLAYKGTQNDRTRNLQSDKSSHMQQSNLLIDMLLLLLDLSINTTNNCITYVAIQGSGFDNTEICGFYRTKI
jgi:hypothetical protein